MGKKCGKRAVGAAWAKAFIVGVSTAVMWLWAPAASAEQLGPVWQAPRDQFNQLSDAACDGDTQALLQLTTAAMANGHPVAKHDLAWLLMTQSCAFAVDDLTEAINLQRAAADAGYPVAQSNFAVRLLEADSVAQNGALAEAYLDSAIRAGYGLAAVELGTHLARGYGVAQDVERARALLITANDLGADDHAIAALQDALEEVDFSRPNPTPDRWSTFDGEAGWDLTRDGLLSARVFVGRNFETGGFYYGLYRVSSDPILHVMGVSVTLSGGGKVELDATGCYGAECLVHFEEVESGMPSSELRIPIQPQHLAQTLNALKSGADVTFRYQTRDSYKEDAFKNMRMSLKGSRGAIEEIQAIQVDTAPAPVAAAVPVVPSDTNAATSEPDYTGGTTFFEPDTKDGDRFCQAQEVSAFPPHFYSEFEPSFQKGWLESADQTLKPANLDYLGSATTVWEWGSAKRRSGKPLVLYSNGAAKRLSYTARDGVFDVYEIFSGSWQRDSGRGVVLRMTSKWKDSSRGYSHVECTGGTLVTQTHVGFRQGKKSYWQSCSLLWRCANWSDTYPEKKMESLPMTLWEWAPGDVAPKQLKWSEPRPD